MLIGRDVIGQPRRGRKVVVLTRPIAATNMPCSVTMPTPSIPLHPRAHRNQTGTILEPSTDPARPSVSQVVIPGDCCDGSACAELGRGADLLIHEATNAYLPAFGDTGGAAALQRDTYRKGTRTHARGPLGVPADPTDSLYPSLAAANPGHSTPEMAGRLARTIGARALLLTHFSQRYHPNAHAVMATIASQAAAPRNSHRMPSPPPTTLSLCRYGRQTATSPCCHRRRSRPRPRTRARHRLRWATRPTKAGRA